MECKREKEEGGRKEKGQERKERERERERERSLKHFQWIATFFQI